HGRRRLRPRAVAARAGRPLQRDDDPPVQRMASLVVVVVLLVALRRTGGLGPRDLPLLAVIGIGHATANGLYTLATRRCLIRLVAVLGSLYPVVTVLSARTFLGERMRRVQNAGVA